LTRQIEATAFRLIGGNRAGYVVLVVACLIGAFLVAGIFGASRDMTALSLLAVIVAYGLWNIVGAVRPKTLLLSVEGVRYRPVLGRERSVPWRAMQAVDHVFISTGFGILIWRDEAGRSHGLGLWLDILDVVREIEAWRDRHS
jgi:hypothetical protein